MPADLTKPFEVNREMLAWAAGLFEGEGTFASRLNNKKDRAITTSIRMTDEDVIKKFHNIVKVGNVQGPSTPKNPKWKPLWTWQTGTFEYAQAVMIMLWPWLGIRRRENIVNQLKKYHLNRPKGKYTRNPKNGRFYIEEIKIGKIN